MKIKNICFAKFTKIHKTTLQLIIWQCKFCNLQKCKARIRSLITKKCFHHRCFLITYFREEIRLVAFIHIIYFDSAGSHRFHSNYFLEFLLQKVWKLGGGGGREGVGRGGGWNFYINNADLRRGESDCILLVGFSFENTSCK